MECTRYGELCTLYVHSIALQYIKQGVYIYLSQNIEQKRINVLKREKCLWVFEKMTKTMFFFHEQLFDR